MKFKYFILGVVILILDQLTKILLINKNLSVIPNFLSLTYTENTGGAFGALNSNTILITIISFIIIIGIIVFIVIKKDEIHNFYPYTLVLAGSIGNLIDRLFRGKVVDFIDVNLFNFPNFNIADICIVIGIFWIVIELIIKIARESIVESKEK